MGFFLTLTFVAIIASGARELCARRRALRYVNLSWSNTIRLPLPQAEAMSAVKRLLRDEHQCRLEHQESDFQLFIRGNHKISSLPIERDVMWPETPVFIGVGYGATSAETIVSVNFKAPKDLVLDKAAADTFHSCAASEFDVIFERLDSCMKAYHEPRPVDRKTGHEAAYAVLNLKPGASWPEVQAAYRERCKLYHPDTLSRQQLPPHVLELAVKEFKVITGAYQELKQVLSR